MAQFIDKKYKMFKSQNTEEGFFDVTFDVEGKLIHAHKFMLASVSEVLKRMISDTWNNGETIKIETYSFNDFYEFLTFLYSGNCSIIDENIFTMVDLSEFYQVKELQQKCDEYLSKKEYTAENVLTYFEALSNYSLPLFEKTLFKAIKENGINLIESDGFLEASKTTVEKIVRFEDRLVSEEKLFEKIYEWAENRIKKKQSESNEEDSRDAKPNEDGVSGKMEKATQTFIFNLNDEIKSELSEILPFINFKKMKLDFLHKFVVKKGFLFSYDELSDILDNAKPDFKVKITNENGESIVGVLANDCDFIEIIKSLKYHPCDYSTTEFALWKETKIKRPSIPSQIKTREGIEWYLYCYNGAVGVIRHSWNPTPYLLAEMTSETSGFKITTNCKIEIV